MRTRRAFGRRGRGLLSVAFCSALLAPSLAHAQQPLPQPATEQGTLPPPPAVDDPDLKPLPPAKHAVASWEEITTDLRARSVDLRIAIDEVGRAEAQRQVAFAGVLGNITATGTYTHNFLTTTSTVVGSTGLVTTTSPTPDFATGGVSANIAVIAPRVWNAIHFADVNIDVQKASRDDVMRVLAALVANDALTVVTTEHIAELNRVGLRQALERYELAKRKTSLGAGTGLDVVRAQQDVESARATLVTGDENARQAREALGVALGVPEDVSVAGDLDVLTLANQVLAQCRAASSIEERPDVIAARERVHLARVNTWDVKTQFFPTLTLQSSLGTTSISYINPQTTWNLQAVLSWNLWEGGARYGNLRDANLQVLEAQEHLDGLRRTALIQVVQAVRGVQVAEQTRTVLTRTRDLAKEVDRLTRAGFLTGAFTSLDLVVAAAALRQAEINLAVADYNVIKEKILAVLQLATCPL